MPKPHYSQPRRSRERYIARRISTYNIHHSSTDALSQITYDLATQVPENDWLALRDQLLLLLKKFAAGPKPVRVQLCVCLAILSIQMRTWKDVLPTVVAALGDDVQSHAAILDFLRVLPEEVTEGRKINLSVRGSPYDTIVTYFGRPFSLVVT